MDITVRAARPADHPAVGRLSVAAYASDGLVGEGPDAPYVATLRDAAGRAAWGALLVAADPDGTVLGTVTYTEEPPHAEVAGPGEAEFRILAVAPEARGRGCGELLVRACLDRASRRGRTAVVLSATGTVPAALRLYERTGFVPVPERNWYPVPGLTLYAYRHDLTGY